MPGKQSDDRSVPGLGLDTRQRRAQFRAGHRGTKELDILLGRFASAHVGTMSPQELSHFEALLEEPEPDLQRAILNGERAPPGFDQLIATIRAFHGLTLGST